MSDLLSGEGAGIALFALLFLLVIVLGALLIVERSARRRLEDRVDRLSAGADGESLEDMLLRIFDDYETLGSTLERNRRDIGDIYERMRTMIQKVGVVKYDAFSQMGGSLSSAIALLDENDDGFIINTVQSVDGCYSYVKTVRGGRPETELGREEEQALEQAQSYGKSF